MRKIVSSLALRSHASPPVEDILPEFAAIQFPDYIQFPHMFLDRGTRNRIHVHWEKGVDETDVYAEA